MKLRLDFMADDKNKFAIMYGPIVLAGALGTEGCQAPIPFAGNNELEYARVTDPKVPSLASAHLPPMQWIRPLAGKPLTFEIFGGKSQPLTLSPVNAANRQRYTVYWESQPANA
jgi:hypothetical protein